MNPAQPFSLANRNSLWAAVFVDELARLELAGVVIAPGSRSTPLTVAFAAREDIPRYSLLDERSAAYFALGLAQASGRPAVLLCTSGTAAANFYPAIIEAEHAQLPLLVLTADRPHELRHSGANQTMDQLRLYGGHVRWFVDVALPEKAPAPRTLRYLRTLACRAVAKACGVPPGPVHLNFPFRKPLEPTYQRGDVPAELSQSAPLGFAGRDQARPITRIFSPQLVPSQQQLEALMDALRGTSRGLIICGPRCPGGEFPKAVVRLARVTGFPVFADPLSGVRFTPHIPQGEASPLILSAYETFLLSKVSRDWPPPEVILLFGALPTSKGIATYLDSLPSTRRIAVHQSGLWSDETHRLDELLWADPTQVCNQLADILEREPSNPTDESWVAALQDAERRSWELFHEAARQTWFEGVILHDVVSLMPQDSLLFVASSLPVRHLDQFAPVRDIRLRTFANRGVSGIDGTISTALGAAAASSSPLVLVTGDLAFYHDMNGLLALRRCGVSATIVLINNDGGGIFHRLPIAQFDPPFTEMFLTPHGLKFAPVAELYGLEYRQPQTREAFRQVFRAALAADAPHLIEVRTDSALHEQVRQKLIECMDSQ